MKIIIELFAKDYVVVELEKGVFLNMPKELLPNMVEEGGMSSTL